MQFNANHTDKCYSCKSYRCKSYNDSWFDLGSSNHAGKLGLTEETQIVLENLVWLETLAQIIPENFDLRSLKLGLTEEAQIIQQTFDL